MMTFEEFLKSDWLTLDLEHNDLTRQTKVRVGTRRLFTMRVITDEMIEANRGVDIVVTTVEKMQRDLYSKLVDDFGYTTDALRVVFEMGRSNHYWSFEDAIEALNKKDVARL